MTYRTMYADIERDALVEEFTSSGMSQAAFAKAKRITARTLRRWLRARGCGPQRPADVNVLARIERVLGDLQALRELLVHADVPAGHWKAPEAAPAPPARLPMPTDMWDLG